MKKPEFQLREIRTLISTLGGFTTREENGKTFVRGYAAVFNSMSEDLGGYKEIIDPAFFNEVLQDDVRCLLNHSDNNVLGRSTAGTLTLDVDAKGLFFEYEDPGTTVSRDLLISLSRGDISQCSFQFEVHDSSEGGYKFERKGEEWFCTLLRCKRLYDVGPVTFPAYTETSIGKRGLEEAKKLLEPPTEFDYSRSLERIKLSQTQF